MARPRGVGFAVGDARVPIIPAAVIYDLGVGDGSVRPDASMGLAACEAATKDAVRMGAVGAGCGATVGKARGCVSSPGGVGSALVADDATGVAVGALAVVNAVGNVVAPDGTVLAGARDAISGAYVDVAARIVEADAGANTTIAVVATNATLTPDDAARVASTAHEGLRRVVKPAHTRYDGDTVFALGTGAVVGDADLVGELAADALAEAIVRAVSF